jgi:hypothetical protein
MARANLGALLGNLDDSIPSVQPTADPTPTTDSEAARTKDRSLVEAIERPASKPVASAEPSYLRFVRKETRLREDQQNQLTQHARRLNRAKTTASARITDNTLIRVAVDLLLARIDTAAGDDEKSILESLNQ